VSSVCEAGEPEYWPLLASPHPAGLPASHPPLSGEG
jgi:hypothetical protein